MPIYVNGKTQITGIASKNASDNDSFVDVIGNKMDSSFSSVVNPSKKPSLIGHLKAGYFHVHAPAKLYPKLDDAIELSNDSAGNY